MNFKSVAFFLCLFLYGCSSKTDNNAIVKSLEPVSEYPALGLNTELLIINDTIPLAPEKMWVEDTLLIMQTPYDYGFLRIYSLRSGELVKSFGLIGRGPEEYLYPEVFKNMKGEYLISDRLKFGILSIDQLLTQKDYKAEIRLVEKGLSAVNFLSMLSENDQIIFNSGSDENQLCFMKLDNMEITPYNNWPQIPGVKINNFIASTNVFHASMNRGGDYIYAAYNLYPIVDIISIHDKTVKRSIHPVSPSVNKVTVIDNLNAVIDNKFLYNLSSCITNDGFYTLYLGDSQDNVENLRTIPEILKYDLSGDLVVRYKLKDMFYNFCIDDEGRNGYFLSLYKDDNPVILKSVLPE